MLYAYFSFKPCWIDEGGISGLKRLVNWPKIMHPENGGDWCCQIPLTPKPLVVAPRNVTIKRRFQSL